MLTANNIKSITIKAEVQQPKPANKIAPNTPKPLSNQSNFDNFITIISKFDFTAFAKKYHDKGALFSAIFQGCSILYDVSGVTYLSGFKFF